MKQRKRGCAIVLACALMLGSLSEYKPMATVKASLKTAQTEETKAKNTEKKVTKKKDATIYDLGNGKKKAEFYAGDVRFMDEDGELKDYDTSLVCAEDVTGDYVYETAESDKMSYFPEKITEKTPVLTEYDGYEVSIHSDVDKKGTNKSRKGKTDTEKVIDLYENQEEKKTSIEYRGIWEDTSLEYESTNDGLKESIILEDDSAPSRYSFVLSLKNCCVVTQKQLMKDKVEAKKSIVTEEGESLYLYDVTENKLVGSLPAGYMMDAAGEYSDGCTYSLKLKKENNSGNDTEYAYEMVVEADKEYLLAEEREYPVTIDPSVVWNWNSTMSQTSSAYVCKSSPNSTYTDENTNILCVGKRDASSSVCRSYIKFEGVNAALTDMYVDKATLTLNTTQANTGMSIYVRNVCSSWNASTITYNSQPKKTEGVLGSFKTTKSAEKVQVSLDANTLYNYTRNEEALYGVELTDSKADNNTTSSKTAWIYNSLSMNNTKIPKLEVEYYEVDRTATPQLKYQVYRKSAGWSAWEEDGETAGDLKESRKLRALKMDFEANGFNVSTVKYRACFENSGWTEWTSEGDTAGDINSDENMKAVEMKVVADTVYPYDVYYRTYVNGRGWLGWAKNGKQAGDYTDGACIEGIQAVVVPQIKLRRVSLVDGKEDAEVIENLDQEGIEVGSGCSIVALGITFDDATLYKKQNITSEVFLKDGTIKKEEVTQGGYPYARGTSENPICGYRMYFNDMNMRAKYDIEHMASIIGAEEEEKWKENMEISGNKQGENIMETFGVRVVPKDYEAGKRACYSDGFVMFEDSFCFENNPVDFEYPISANNEVLYYFPDEKYEFLNLDVAQALKKWNGSCFGMSLTCYLFHTGFWNVSDFVGEFDRGAISPYRMCRQSNRKTRKLTDLIEYGQIISWYQLGFKKISGLSSVVQALSDMENIQYIAIMRGKDSNGNSLTHAVIPNKIDTNDGNCYEIQLYDPNDCDASHTAYIDVERNTFSYTVGGDYTNISLLNASDFVEKHETKLQAIAEKVKTTSY